MTSKALIKKIPDHVAIIMDGNGRWAELKGKHRALGHKHGVKALRKAIIFAHEKKIKILTIFAFSSENWKRPKQEVNMLMELFFTVLDGEVKKLNENNIQLNVIGDVSGFNERLQQKIHAAQILTQHNTGLVLNVAANYGGRWDIANATKQIAQQVQVGDISIDDIDESLLTKTLPLSDVDFMIRTGGDHRISNFLLWQLAYAELYFTEQLWPDFDAEAFQVAIDVFSGKERRFGQTSAQVK